MSTGPFDFAPGEQLCIDIAFPFARSSQENNNLDAIIELRQAADYIQNFYDNQNFNCNMQVIGIDEKANEGNVVSVYPNPSNGRFVIRSSEEISAIEVYDALGKKVFAKKSNRNNSQTMEMDLSRESEGIYFYIAYTQSGIAQRGKLIIE